MTSVPRVATKEVVVVVVGTGLAGLTAAHQLLAAKSAVSKVILMEKTGVVGYASNSNKASSGINGVYTDQQASLQIEDTIDDFIQDSITSAKNSARPDLIQQLAERSKLAIDYLTHSFQIDLSKVSQLGGHSNARTHRGNGNLPPGYAIISSMVRSLDHYTSRHHTNPRLEILKNSKIVQLLVEGEENKVIGLKYEDSNVQPSQIETLKADHVILATGGYSADFGTTSGTGTNSLLQQHRPELVSLPSTNGQQTTGDGIKLAKEIGAQLVDMDKIQIHPTGFVDPLDRNNQWKILAAEVLRGQGGILLNQKGERFVNELTTRDKVTEAIFSQGAGLAQAAGNNNNEIFLLLPESSFEQLGTHLGFYISKKLMQRCSLKDFVQDNELDFNTVKRTLKEYDNVALNSAGGDVEDKYGRKSFGPIFGDIDQVSDQSQGSDQDIYYGIVTPVLHFSMGGIKIDTKSRVLNTNNEVINGLYAIGEVSGGVHGFNRLGGSSLLECVVSGTIAAETILNSGNQ